MKQTPEKRRLCNNVKHAAHGGCQYQFIDGPCPGRMEWENHHHRKRGWHYPAEGDLQFYDKPSAGTRRMSSPQFQLSICRLRCSRTFKPDIHLWSGKNKNVTGVGTSKKQFHSGINCVLSECRSRSSRYAIERTSQIDDIWRTADPEHDVVTTARTSTHAAKRLLPEQCRTHQSHLLSSNVQAHDCGMSHR